MGCARRSLEAPLADLEIFAEALIERAAGIHEEIIEPRAASFGAQRLDVLVDFLAVFAPGVFGRDLERIGGVFEIVEQDGLAEFWLDLLRIEHVEEDDLVALVAERLARAHDEGGVGVEIRHDDYRSE